MIKKIITPIFSINLVLLFLFFKQCFLNKIENNKITYKTSHNGSAILFFKKDTVAIINKDSIAFSNKLGDIKNPLQIKKQEKVRIIHEPIGDLISKFEATYNEKQMTRMVSTKTMTLVTYKPALKQLSYEELKHKFDSLILNGKWYIKSEPKLKL